MSGPKGKLKEAWARISKLIDLDEPTSMGLFLGCNHREITVYPDGVTPVRGIEYDMRDSMKQCVEAYQKVAGNYSTKLKHADTPHHPLLWGATGETSERVATPSDVPVDLEVPDWGEEAGVLAPQACSILMKIMYGARIARWDLLKIVQLLSTRVSKWTVSCDKALFRLICYINSTLDVVLSGYIGDKQEDLFLLQYADADWAGDRADYRSTSGAICYLSGPLSKFPLAARCTKQTATSFSTPESDLIAANSALRLMGIPSLDFWEALLGRKVTLEFREDNQTAIVVMKTGRNQTMRHLPRCHGISLSWLHEVISWETVKLVYQDTGGQCADIFTKVFKTAQTWFHAVNLIGMTKHGTGGKQALPETPLKSSCGGDAQPTSGTKIQKKNEKQQAPTSAMPHACAPLVGGSVTDSRKSCDSQGKGGRPATIVLQTRVDRRSCLKAKNSEDKESKSSITKTRHASFAVPAIAATSKVIGSAFNQLQRYIYCSIAVATPFSLANSAVVPISVSASSPGETDLSTSTSTASETMAKNQAWDMKQMQQSLASVRVNMVKTGQGFPRVSNTTDFGSLPNHELSESKYPVGACAGLSRESLAACPAEKLEDIQDMSQKQYDDRVRVTASQSAGAGEGGGGNAPLEPAGRSPSLAAHVVER